MPRRIGMSFGQHIIARCPDRHAHTQRVHTAVHVHDSDAQSQLILLAENKILKLRWIQCRNYVYLGTHRPFVCVCVYGASGTRRLSGKTVETTKHTECERTAEDFRTLLSVWMQEKRENMHNTSNCGCYYVRWHPLTHAYTASRRTHCTQTWKDWKHTQTSEREGKRMKASWNIKENKYKYHIEWFSIESMQVNVSVSVWMCRIHSVFLLAEHQCEHVWVLRLQLLHICVLLAQALRYKMYVCVFVCWIEALLGISHTHTEGARDLLANWDLFLFRRMWKSVFGWLEYAELNIYQSVDCCKLPSLVHIVLAAYILTLVASRVSFPVYEIVIVVIHRQIRTHERPIHSHLRIVVTQFPCNSVRLLD